MAYQEVDQGTFEQRNEVAQNRKTGGGPDYWKPKAGQNGKSAKYRIRILPPHEGMNRDPFVETKIHYSLGPDPNNLVAINCLVPFGEDCPACNHVAKLDAQAKSEDDEDTKKKLLAQVNDQRAQLRIYAQIIDMDHPEKGVQRYAFGVSVEKQLRQCFFDDDGNWRNITHPKSGRDVIMMVTESNKVFNGRKVPEYSIRPAESATALKTTDWLDAIQDLSELAKQPTTDAVLLALKGQRPDRGSQSTTSTPAAKPAAKPAPEPKKETAAPPAKAAAPAKAPEKPKRQAVVEEEDPPVEDVDPWAPARTQIGEMIEAGTVEKDFEPAECSEEEEQKIKKPNCYTKETDPTDPMCQGCKVLLPCLTKKLAA